MPSAIILDLFETNHGLDGWDARTVLKAQFTGIEKASKWLRKRGYRKDAKTGWYRTGTPNMGEIIYELRPHVSTAVPIDPD